MEYICGLDLNKTRQTIPYFPEEVAVLLIAQLGLAVQHLHLKGFLHRDIKVLFTSAKDRRKARDVIFSSARHALGSFRVLCGHCR